MKVGEVAVAEKVWAAVDAIRWNAMIAATGGNVWTCSCGCLCRRGEPCPACRPDLVLVRP